MRFRHHGGALLALALVLTCALPARADNYPAKDASGTTWSYCSKLWTGVQYPCHIMMGMFGSQPTALAVDGSGNVGVNVQSSSLPAGAANATKQDTGNTSLGSIDTKLTSQATAANQASANTKLDQLHTDNQDTRASTQTVTAADIASTSTAGQNGVSVITGSPTANSAATFAVNGQSGGALTVSGTFSLTGQAEASYDGGTTYVAASALQRGSGLLTSQVTGPGAFSVDLNGVTNIRVRATSYTSGTMSVKLTASPAPGMTKILNPVLPGPSASTTDRSVSSWTTGGTAQAIMAANAARRSFYVLNPNVSDDCWASVTTTAAVNGAGSFRVAANGGGFGMEVSPTTNALSVVCPTTGDKLTAWESQ